MSQPVRSQGDIIVVDDDVDTANLLRDALVVRGFNAHALTTAEECLGLLAESPAEIVITDVNMPGLSGIELCQRMRRDYPATLMIVITGATGLDTAIEAIRAGAYDYLTKPVKTDALAIAVTRALQHAALKRELLRLRAVADRELPEHQIVGSSPAIARTIEMVERIAASDASVLVTGESGTGKELVARALHRLSNRRDRPFVAINCGAMPAPLLESELFGHVRGAFTDAKQSRPGLFVQAEAGTIFLDEIGEMPLEMQAKLLRVLQERRVRPVGSDTDFPINARVVTATNRNLEREIEEKRFREDLYYRVNVVSIAVPSLRERSSDILLLAQRFLLQQARASRKAVVGLSRGVAEKLLAYDWPGNVRELENCMARAVALCQHTEITIDDLPASIVEHGDAKMVFATSSPVELGTIDELARRYVGQVLAATGGNKSRAAKILGIDRRSLYRRLAPTATASELEIADTQPEPQE